MPNPNRLVRLVNVVWMHASVTEMSDGFPQNNIRLEGELCWSINHRYGTDPAQKSYRWMLSRNSFRAYWLKSINPSTKWLLTLNDLETFHSQIRATNSLIYFVLWFRIASSNSFTSHFWCHMTPPTITTYRTSKHQFYVSRCCPEAFRWLTIELALDQNGRPHCPHPYVLAF